MTERTAICVWCDGPLTTSRPWRHDEYQVHADCWPALEAYQAEFQRVLAAGIDKAIADLGNDESARSLPGEGSERAE